MQENSDRLVTLLSKIFEVDKNAINDETSPKDLDKWDSFNTLQMVFKVEKEFKITVNLEEVIVIKCVKDIKILLANKGININV